MESQNNEILIHKHSFIPSIPFLWNHGSKGKSWLEENLNGRVCLEGLLSVINQTIVSQQ